MTRVGEFSLLRLVGVELEKVGDDFGFGRVVRKAVGGNGQDARCPCGGRLGEPPLPFAAKMAAFPVSTSPP